MDISAAGTAFFCSEVIFYQKGVSGPVMAGGTGTTKAQHENNAESSSQTEEEILLNLHNQTGFVKALVCCSIFASLLEFQRHHPFFFKVSENHPKSVTSQHRPGTAAPMLGCSGLGRSGLGTQTPGERNKQSGFLGAIFNYLFPTSPICRKFAVEKSSISSPSFSTLTVQS